MGDLDLLRVWRDEIGTELHENILRYWLDYAVDREHGGFVGRVLGTNRVASNAAKGAVLNARILWAFSAACRRFHRADYRAAAQRAHDYLTGHFLDPAEQGVFWMLDHRGRPLDTKKQVYAQAFAIYALVEFHAATEDPFPLDRARALFRVLESHARDVRWDGYFEAFSHDWRPLEDFRLSERDENEKKSMNTHLHLLEAYTSLFAAWPDSELRERLRRLVQLFLDRIIDVKLGRSRLFFDESWQVRSGKTSYGHDIECAWLLERASRTLRDEPLAREVAAASLRLADTVLREAIGPDGGLAYERSDDGRLDLERHWWPQAEAVVGFLNAYRLCGEARFLEAAWNSWAFIRSHIVDPKSGEWRWSVAPDGNPTAMRDKIGPWKGPYHNTRACLEAMERIDALLGE